MIIDNIKALAKQAKKKIILPETMDERVLNAASIVVKEGIADLVLIGEKEKTISNYPILANCEWINPNTFENMEDYLNQLVEIRKNKGLTKEEAKNLLLNDYMYLSCMLLINNKADGIVSGACHTSSNTLRPALQIIKGKEELISSFFLMEVPNCQYGENGVFIFSDCGLNQNPNSEQLSIIAKQSIETFKQLVKTTPKLAFLSYSTYNSSSHVNVDKVRKAVEIAKAKNPNELIDGELQLDAAIIPEIAKIKASNSILKGQANILIFPDLDSGNIGYKLVERLGKAKAYGPLIQGINYPVNDLSRGCSIDDIVGVIAITCIQAIK